MLKSLCVLIFFGGFGMKSFSQNCNCTHTIDTRNSTAVNLIKASNYTYKAGDVFCIKGGNTAGLRFIGFIGSETKPITFINCGGQVIIDEKTYSGIAFQGSKYIHLTGTGSSDQYGFYVRSATNGGGMGVSVGSLSSDVEIDHVEIGNTGFAGIMAKTDPVCNDPSTWRRNGFVLRNLNIHHNYIHDTGGEGMYIGYTGGYKVSTKLNCGTDGYAFGHFLEHVNIHHNRLENTGWDGIQVNLTILDANIHHNEIIGYGTEDELYQNSGMSIGSSDLKVYNNLIKQTHNSSIDDNGMTVIGALSGSQFYNNIIAKCKGYGLFAHNRYLFENPDTGYYFMHNTVIETGKSGIFYNGTITEDANSANVGNQQLTADVRFYNNLVVDPGVDYTTLNFWKKNNESFIDFISLQTRDIAKKYNNVFSRDLAGLLLNPDYSISSIASPLVDSGAVIPFFTVLKDYTDAPRITGKRADVGAFEYSLVNGFFETENSQVRLFPNPGNQFLTISGVDDISTITLFNNQGSPVLETQQASFQVESLPIGFYVVQIEKTNGEKISLNYLKW